MQWPLTPPCACGAACRMSQSRCGPPLPCAEGGVVGWLRVMMPFAKELLLPALAHQPCHAMSHACCCTLGAAAPLLRVLLLRRRMLLQALVVCPSQELAMQVMRVAKALMPQEVRRSAVQQVGGWVGGCVWMQGVGVTGGWVGGRRWEGKHTLRPPTAGRSTNAPSRGGWGCPPPPYHHRHHSLLPRHDRPPVPQCSHPSPPPHTHTSTRTHVRRR